MSATSRRVTRMKYELEVGGKVIKRMTRYDSIREWAVQNTDQPFEIYVRRRSAVKRLIGKIGEADMGEAVRLRKEKWEWAAIAKYLGWNPDALQAKVRREYGEQINLRATIGGEKREQVSELYAAGMGLNDIAAKVGLKYNSVWAILHRTSKRQDKIVKKRA